MKGWQKGALITLVVFLIVGGYLAYVFKSRQDPGVMGTKGEKPKQLSKDDLAVVKLLYLPGFDDAKQLEGKPLWVKAGYTLPYYPVKGTTVEFAKKEGTLPPDAKLNVDKLIKAVPPAKEDDRLPHGTKQYFATFTIDGKDGKYAAPIGFAEGTEEKMWTDDLFFYDDPKTIYDHWTPAVWDAVAKHTPTVGMTEAQVRMAVGMQIQSDSSREGDRTVTYDTGSKKWTVTFAKGAATQVAAA